MNKKPCDYSSALLDLIYKKVLGSALADKWLNISMHSKPKGIEIWLIL